VIAQFVIFDFTMMFFFGGEDKRKGKKLPLLAVFANDYFAFGKFRLLTT
jgi:hypothetical protein